MFANEKDVIWLLENRSQYFINKNTGVPQSTLSDLKNGKKDIRNITFENAAKLTQLSQSEQKEPTQ